MIRFLTDFRKTALIAGIAIAVSVLWSFFLQVLVGPHGSTSDLVGSIAISLVLLLFELPLPVFLVLLYRTGITPALSRNLRFVAVALVAIRTSAVLFDIGRVWRAGILPVASNAVSPAWSQSWFFLSPANHWWTATLMISNVVNVASRLAFIFFLVAIACQVAPSQNADKRASRQVRNAALVAIFTGALSIILLIIFQVYAHAVRTYGQAGAAATLRSLLFALPGLIAPLIILVGIIRSPRITNADNFTVQHGGAPSSVSGQC
jgi:hypothetical protein